MQPSRVANTKAFTLVETLVASVLIIFVLFGATTVLLMILTRAAQQRNDLSLESANQRCATEMTKALKEAKQVIIYNSVADVETNTNPTTVGNVLGVLNPDNTVSVWAFEEGGIEFYHNWYGADPAATEFSRYKLRMVQNATPLIATGGSLGLRVLFSLEDGIPQARWNTANSRGELLEVRVTSALSRMR